MTILITDYRQSVHYSFVLTLLLILFQTIQVAAQDSVQLKLDTFIGEGHYPGVCFSVYDAETGESMNYAGGYADVEKGIPMSTDNLLMSGSSGKTFVAAILMQLIQEGKLSPDDHIDSYLGEEAWFRQLPNGEILTILHLMQHQSGLARYVFKPEFIRSVKSDPEREWQPEELVAFILSDSALFAPGENFAYSDTNYILLGMIIEQVTGKSYYDNLEDRLLKPLSLTGIVPTNTRHIDGLAQGYMGEHDPLGFEGPMLENGTARYNLQFEWTGGGLAFRTADFARWLGLLFNGRAFDMDEMKETYFNIVEAKEIGGRYGMGFQVMDLPGTGTVYGHGGFFPGYYTLGIYLPERKKAVAMQVNTTDPQKLRNFFRDFLALTNEALK